MCFVCFFNFVKVLSRTNKATDNAYDRIIRDAEISPIFGRPIVVRVFSINALEKMEIFFSPAQMVIVQVVGSFYESAEAKEILEEWSRKLVTTIIHFKRSKHNHPYAVKAALGLVQVETLLKVQNSEIFYLIHQAYELFKGGEINECALKLLEIANVIVTTLGELGLPYVYRISAFYII